MKKLAVVTFLALITFALTGLALAAEKAEAVTLEGKVVCAKCTLKESEYKECQNVLQVTEKGSAKPVNYYITDNETGTEFGHVCMKQVYAKVTGQVSEKEGKKWIAATKIEKVEKG